MWNIARNSATFLMLVGLLMGCGPRGPRTFRIPGKLVYDDGTPVPGASVVLRTKLAGQDISARGMSGPEGKFQLTTFQEGDGVVAGEHQVAVFPLPAPAGAKTVPRSIHGKYWILDTSDLTTSVTPETKTIVITIVRGK